MSAEALCEGWKHVLRVLPQVKRLEGGLCERSAGKTRKIILNQKQIGLFGAAILSLGTYHLGAQEARSISVVPALPFQCPNITMPANTPPIRTLTSVRASPNTLLILGGSVAIVALIGVSVMIGVLAWEWVKNKKVGPQQLLKLVDELKAEHETLSNLQKDELVAKEKKIQTLEKLLKISEETAKLLHIRAFTQQCIMNVMKGSFKKD